MSTSPATRPPSGPPATRSSSRPSASSSASMSSPRSCSTSRSAPPPLRSSTYRAPVGGPPGGARLRPPSSRSGPPHLLHRRHALRDDVHVVALLGVYLLVVTTQPSAIRPSTSTSPSTAHRLLFSSGLLLGFAASCAARRCCCRSCSCRSGSLRRALAVDRPQPGCRRDRHDADGRGMDVRNAVQLDAPVSSRRRRRRLLDRPPRRGPGDSARPAATRSSRPPRARSRRAQVRADSEGFRKGPKFAVTHPAQELVLPFKSSSGSTTTMRKG